MAYTFLKQAGLGIGNSRCEEHLLGQAANLRELAAEKDVRLLLPIDHVCAATPEHEADATIHGPGIPDGLMALDIGPETIGTYLEPISSAGTIVWNGPMGVFERLAFRRGTEAVANAVARSKAFTLVGGGDSVAAIELLGLPDQIDHLSTGGGAGLRLLEGRPLPGVVALQR